HHHGQPQRAAISSEAQAAYDKANDYGPGRPQEYEDENAGYHPGVGPGQASNQRHSVHPAYRGEGQNWDPWAGVQRNDQEGGRAPTYRTNDPHG
ncbi:hypothetical protein LTS01_026055, partial [Friedmanniomyces endolithicus]